MDLETLLATYDRRVPRYTSYPTAPQFSPAVDAGRLRGWLGALADDTPLSLYLHVPFCAELCWFCGCHTTVAQRPEPLARYAAALLDEIDLLAGAIGRSLPVRHIHWGGGTPTALSPAWMIAIASRLRARFAQAPDAEVAVEVDPRTLTDAAADAMAAIGVTRASLGVQDFDPVVQAAVHRHQSFAVTEAAAQRLRARGIGGINLDLIYGLPHQTEAGVAETVARALSLGPDRVAVFGYAHVPWLKRHQKLLDEAALPGPPARFAQRAAAERVILAAGYEAVGLDHYALPEDSLAVAARAGRVRRNFQGYTTDTAPVLLGLGASSIGVLPDGYVQNETAIPAWHAALRDGRLPIARGVVLTAEDRLRRAVIEQVMCGGEVDLPAIAARHGMAADTLLDAGPALRAQAADGLIRWDGARLKVTARGRPFVRAVASAFDAYLRPDAVRHAAAI
ncbi:MAG: oxygen-independent coproporphyrinogen III oxidase [Proteobacteria bacterium]|nr:oxygen-independent coproporphyrinogen III oxidase [Pseudomonadota bacterium]